MHLVKRIVASGGAAILAAVAAISLAQSAAASDVVGHVYVNDNTAGVNTIAGFDRHADGTLTPLAGSPFAAGGAGTSTIVGPQGPLQVSRHDRLPLAYHSVRSHISRLPLPPAV